MFPQGLWATMEHDFAILLGPSNLEAQIGDQSECNPPIEIEEYYFFAFPVAITFGALGAKKKVMQKVKGGGP